MRVLLLVALVGTIGCAASPAPVLPVWLTESEVTVYRLRGYGGTPRADGGFHGIEILESRTISAEFAASMLQVAREAWLRRKREELEEQRSGRINGGVWGCVSGETGIRFASREGNVDFLFQCDLWLDPAEHRGESVAPIVFTREEGRQFRSVLNKAWP